MLLKNCNKGLIALLLISLSSFAIADVTRVKYSISREETKNKKGIEKLILPYAFSSDRMGFNVGLGGMVKGFYQEQMAIGATGFAGEDSHGIWAGLFNYQIDGTERFFFSAQGLFGYYPEQRSYAGGRIDPVPEGTHFPGSNDSSEDQYIEGKGRSDWIDAKLEYALPIGATRDEGLVRYHLQNGLLISEPSGGKEWNPLTSGVTVATLRYFDRYQKFELDDGDVSGDFGAFELGLLYDNTDFAVNPTMGSRQYISYSTITPWDSSDDDDWDFWQFSASKYINFGETEHAHHRVLAMNFWTGYSPSWDVKSLGDGTQQIIDGTPYNEGATLGGFKRMRGYDMYRFNDKASIYTSAEYRYTFKNNPVENVDWLRFLRLDWLQLVGFVEAGRVAPEYTLSTLTEDLKFDYGVSLRAMMAGLVVRTDLAVSEETTNFWIMVDHPF